MREHYGIQGKAVCILVSILGGILFSAGIIDNAFAQSTDGSKLSVVQEGSTLKLEYTPGQGNVIPVSPAKEGVPKRSPDDFDSAIIPTWPCQNIGQVPNQQCPPMYEDRLGCNNGGATKYCDTRQTPGGMACVCVNVGQ